MVVYHLGRQYFWIKFLHINKCFSDQDFYYEDMESLTQMLRTLATDGNKHRAKVDKRKRRSVFRDILRAVEVGFLML